MEMIGGKGCSGPVSCSDDLMTTAGGARQGALGRYLAQHDTPALTVRVLQKTDVLVREVRSARPPDRDLDILPPDDAVIVATQLRDFPRHEYWEAGRKAPISDLQAGQICLYDLRREIGSRLDKPFHSLHFYLPMAVLDAAAEEEELPRLHDLSYEPGRGVSDPTIEMLAKVLRTALQRPECASRVFVEHVTMAVASHILRTYGLRGRRDRPLSGGLAAWQARRATEQLAANLEGSASLTVLARDLGLSVSHFSRAFRATLGVPPHQWLLERRVEKAKALLRGHAASLAEIALLCGFTDQSHFTRTFTRRVGVSPGAWRRDYAPSGSSSDASP